MPMTAGYSCEEHPDLQHIVTFHSHQILLFDADIPFPITYGKRDLEKKLQAITEACGVSPSIILVFSCPFRMII